MCLSVSVCVFHPANALPNAVGCKFSSEGSMGVGYNRCYWVLPQRCTFFENTFMVACLDRDAIQSGSALYINDELHLMDGPPGV